MHKETLTLDNKVSQPFIETSSSDLVYLHIVRSLHKIPTSLLCPCLFCHIRSKFPYLYSLFLSLHILIYLKFLYHTCGVEIIYGSYNGSILLTLFEISFVLHTTFNLHNSLHCLYQTRLLSRELSTRARICLFLAK